jgi:4'-phosphopantetheinyl transferase EntD
MSGDRTPIWPFGVIGSITHTAGLCIAGVANVRNVAALGLDCEVVGAATVDIWSSICRSRELDWVKSLPALQRPAAITLIFSAKEAFYKCQYTLDREWLDFHDLQVEVSSWPEAQGSFTIHAIRPIKFAERKQLPMDGQYIFHEKFVTTSVLLPALNN